MARIIVVTSGKGGVGKTTSSAAIATGLAQKGKKTVVIDFDIGLRNLDLIMGCERRVVLRFCKRHSGRCDTESGADQR
ncbi:septum site determining protein [Salmonella enterica subsp. enterica]|uniref:Septum site determining protein n=2 Tax=Enterobacteriaceae TaxID=543 RepID=A0A3S4HVL0_SALET|nr:septum site determining protein [Salmonella enterica subsp. enterica]